ncbi:MAG: CsbD family protein [Alphaproteobacteria bacterium]|nr:MAG: CsbD family protein [Alphaproteobacteria bacterium]
MDKDRIDGIGNQAGGKIKEGVGKLVGDKKMETEGQAQQVKGKVENAAGGVKDAIRDTDR